MPIHDHLRNEANILDPDDGISWRCTACKLPIFATPFSGGGATLLHDQCADLPAVLKNSDLHPQQLLFLRDNNDVESCSECSQKCGSKLYYCQNSGCGLVLDVACALPVKILHRSHHHRLVAVRGGAGGICGVCGVAHKTAAASAEARSYSCNVCGFWIHPECATSPNVIEHEKHVHPLVLYYDVGASVGAQYSTPLDFDDFISRIDEDSTAPPQTQKNNVCGICRNDVGTRVGIYACIECRDCMFHIYCATSDPRSFKPVSSREARFPSLVRLPIADEHQSIVGCIREAAGSNDDGDKKYSAEYAHNSISESDKHRFIFHDDHIKSDEDGGVCDACLKIIDKPPFYSCSECPKMFLHDHCYRFPILLFANPAHAPDHKFILVLADRLIGQGNVTCSLCRCPLIRACYACCDCLPQEHGKYFLDAPCAVMPEVVTHEAHSTAHFLRLSESKNRRSRDDLDCACCLRPLGMLAYECRTCQDFSLHTWCAMLPKTVTHKFDTHPLQLTTNACAPDICEICEKEIDEKVWRYSCESCNQSFHVDCIPCLDMIYKIMSLVSEGVEVPNVPNRLWRGLTLQGHGHGDEYCREVADEYDDILASH